jgi:hypothetical protein
VCGSNTLPSLWQELHDRAVIEDSEDESSTVSGAASSARFEESGKKGLDRMLLS